MVTPILPPAPAFEIPDPEPAPFEAFEGDSSTWRDLVEVTVETVRPGRKEIDA